MQAGTQARHASRLADRQASNLIQIICDARPSFRIGRCRFPLLLLLPALLDHPPEVATSLFIKKPALPHAHFEIGNVRSELSIRYVAGKQVAEQLHKIECI